MNDFDRKTSAERNESLMLAGFVGGLVLLVGAVVVAGVMALREMLP